MTPISVLSEGAPVPEPLKESSLAHTLDAYKLTVAHFAEGLANSSHEIVSGENPHVQFTFTNRTTDVPLANYAPPQEVADLLQQASSNPIFSQADITFLSMQKRSDGSPLYDPGILAEIGQMHMPDEFRVGEKDGQLDIEVGGDWSEVTFVETFVLSQVAEMYYARKLSELGISQEQTWQQAESTLRGNLARYREIPGFKVAEFGTRRRISGAWHRRALEIIGNELYEGQLIGTSNIAFAREFNLPLIGTYPHEVPMIWAALVKAKGEPKYLTTTLRSFHEEWYKAFGPKLAVGLTDVFGSDLFDKAWTSELAMLYRGYREDSHRSPRQWMAQRLAMLQRLGLNSSDIALKTFLFTNGLTPELAREILEDPMAQQIQVAFGIGGNLVGNLGNILRPLNIVMKPTSVNGLPTVKLSDDDGKTQGTEASEYMAQALRELNSVYE